MTCHTSATLGKVASSFRDHAEFKYWLLLTECSELPFSLFVK